MSLQGCKVVVIGGGSGIGKAVARAAVEEGAEVIIAGRNEETLYDACRELGEAVDRHVLDIRDDRDIAHSFEILGRINHLVITASALHQAQLLDIEPEEGREMMETKFWGQLAVVQEAASVLEWDGSITLFSGHSDVYHPGEVMMAAVNGAINGMIPALAVELNPIRVNAVAPSRPSETEPGPEKTAANLDLLAATVVGLMNDTSRTGEVIRVETSITPFKQVV